MKKKRKKWVILFLLCLSFSLLLVPQRLIFASDTASETEERDESELSSTTQEKLLSEFSYGEMDDVLEQLFPDERMSFQKLVKEVLSGDIKLSFSLLKRLLKEQIFSVFYSCRENLIQILVVTILASVFQNFVQVFRNKQVAEISFYVIFLLLIALCLHSFQTVMEWTGNGILRLTRFMTAFGPIYFAAVAIAKGSVTAVAFYQLVLFAIYLAEVLISYVLLPVIHLFFMIKILDFLSARETLSKFAEWIQLIVSWFLKMLLGCVVGINVLQGLLSPAIDSVKRSTLTRGAEAIPGVGNAIGGMTEVVLGTVVLVKNGIGIVGLILCLALWAGPLLQVGLIALMYKLAAAVIQPISGKRVAGCIDCVGDGLRLLMEVLFVTGMLFMLTIVIVSFLTGPG